MKNYKTYFTDKTFLISFVTGFLFLVASLVMQFYANAYTIRKASVAVTDIILSNTRVYDVDGLFVYGSVLLFLVVLTICIIRINYTPFIMKSVALFTMIRACFITLTHISPFPTHVEISSVFFRHTLFSGIFTGDGLFFSGHTGLPFLLALIFWKQEKLRYLFLCFSVILAIVVLLGHLHYSIDVLSAYFITYSIFHLCQVFFKKEQKIFYETL